MKEPKVAVVGLPGLDPTPAFKFVVLFVYDLRWNRFGLLVGPRAGDPPDDPGLELFVRTGDP